MSQRSKRSVYIVNPVSDRRHTSRRSARRYVEQQRARWVGQNAIEFVSSDRRHQAAAIAPAPAAPAARHSPRIPIAQFADNEPSPETPVLPPWPEALARMNASRGVGRR